MMINYEKVKYNSESTILRCNECKHENIEWYNDQPGDKCLINNCRGYYFRENKHNKIGKKYQTCLSESHRPDLHPNGKVVRCVEDKGNGYLIITTEEKFWLTHEKNLREII